VTIVVAIDGPAASGKSSTARRVADRAGLRHIDSGALYRAVTAAQLRSNPRSETWTAASLLAAAGQVDLQPISNAFRPLIGGADSSDEIRGGAVTSSVSRVAQVAAVRDWVNGRVRELAGGYDVVVDGRDIGTVVFPDATLKVFLVADPWERARRRLLERQGRSPSDAEIAAETEQLVRRDAADANQTIQARDAVIIDTTSLAEEEQVQRIVALIDAVRVRGALDSRG